jgi:hypothetical protein
MGKSLNKYYKKDSKRTVKDKDLTPKNKDDRKKFCYRGESWATKAKGGDGNKRAWLDKFFTKYRRKRIIEKEMN